jgi:hypothetical protein
VRPKSNLHSKEASDSQENLLTPAPIGFDNTADDPIKPEGLVNDIKIMKYPG